jgi:dolichol kinase
MNTRFRLIAHPHEMHRITSSSWYSLGLAAAMVISGGVGPAAYLGAAILGFSDPAAGLVGRRFGRHRIVNGRSVEGSAAFVVAGLVAGIAALLLSGSVASLPVAAILALGAVLPAALVELFVRRIDDNLTIPVAAALGARATELLLLPALGLA